MNNARIIYYAKNLQRIQKSAKTRRSGHRAAERAALAAGRSRPTEQHEQTGQRLVDGREKVPACGRARRHSHGEALPRRGEQFRQV